jgi:hypothetical protein
VPELRYTNKNRLQSGASLLKLDTWNIMIYNCKAYNKNHPIIIAQKLDFTRMKKRSVNLDAYVS